MPLAGLSAGFQSLPPLFTSKLGGWVCVHSRTLWGSPTNSPVRLGVSPTAASTPTGFFSQRFWGFIFPALESWVVWFFSLPSQLFLLVYQHANVVLTAPPATTLPAPVLQLIYKILYYIEMICFFYLPVFKIFIILMFYLLTLFPPSKHLEITLSSLYKN